MGSGTLIVGFGNTLRRDDGIGPAVIAHLRNIETNSNITMLDGGTDGFALIDYAKEYEKVIIIDAVNMDLPPGEIRVFTPEEAIINIKTDSLSTHGFGLAEVLKLLDGLELKHDLKIIGIQPEDISFGEGLSLEVMDKVSEIGRLARLFVRGRNIRCIG